MRSTGPNENPWLHAALLGVGFGAMFALGLPVGLLALPLIAWVLARWWVLGLAAIARRGEYDALKEWNGRYFAFDDRQVRIHWDERNIWVVADDVFALLSVHPDATEREKLAIRLGLTNLRRPPGIESECFNEEGVRRFLASNRQDVSDKLQAWFDRQVFPIIRRRRERA